MSLSTFHPWQVKMTPGGSTSQFDFKTGAKAWEFYTAVKDAKNFKEMVLMHRQWRKKQKKLDYNKI